MESPLIQYFKPVHDGDIVDWADGKLKIPYSTQYPIYVASVSPWLIEPLRCLSDPKIYRVDVRMPAGAAKSLIGEILIAKKFCDESGMIYYVWQADDEAGDAMEDRIYQLIESNDFLSRRLPRDRNKKRTHKLSAPHVTIYAVGANESAAQSKRVNTLIMEEPHMWKPGMYKAFMDRTKSVKNPLILSLSTGSILNDESDKSYCSGSCEEWQVPCPHCNEYQAMTDSRDRLLATIDDSTVDENGEYNWPALIPTVRYNCEHCGIDWPTDKDFRHEQAKQGRYKVTNPNAPSNHRSFHMEAVGIYYEGFELSEILKLKLEAVQSYKCGAIEPFKNYMQKQRAMAWDESPSNDDDKAAFDRTKGNYAKGDPHESELSRFLTIDNQAGKASRGQGAHRWYTCRSFGPTECRLIDEGRVSTWEEMEEKRIALGVEPRRTLVDCAFDTIAVQEVCVRYGWQALWGDTTSKDSFPHHENVMTPSGPIQMVRHHPYSRPQAGHVGIGKSGKQSQAVYYFWCQRPIKDQWHRLMDGMTTYRWTVPHDVSDEYRKQTRVEFKKQITGKDGKKKWEWFFPKGCDNHLTDCDQMTLVAGWMDPRIKPYLGAIENEQQTNE